MSRVGKALLFLTATACGSGATPPVATFAANPVREQSPLCQAMLDHFVGLPGLGDAATSAQEPASAGRWWIRSCSTVGLAKGVRVRLDGPGWYFVDQHGADFAIRQQVEFSLGVAVDVDPHLTIDAGVAALWLQPTNAPQIDLRLISALHVQPTSAWGTFLSFAPMISISSRAAEQLSLQAVEGLKAAFRDGATATYDFKSAQPDVTLGKLRPGVTPTRPFADKIPWLVNDRLLLPPSGTQVLGPITPGPTRLDARIERGPGLTFRTVCADDMESGFDAIANGDASEAPPGGHATHGTFDGVGPHSALFSVDRCNFFVVVAGRGDASTVAALRIRG